VKIPALKDLSIRTRMMLVATLTSGGALLLAAIGFTVFDVYVFKSQKLANVRFRAELVAQSSTAAVEFKELKPIEDIFAVVSTDRHVMAAVIYDDTGNIFASYTRPDLKALPVAPPGNDGHLFTTHSVLVHHPIVVEGRKVGSVLIQSDFTELRERMQRHAGIAGLVLLASIAAALFLSAWLQRLVSKPLLALAQTTRNVATEKNFTLRVPKIGNDEVGQVVDGFNEMLDEIQARDAALRHAQDELEHRVEARTHELQAEVAERRRAEDALRESQSLYLSLVEHLPIAVYRKDAKGKVTFGNAFFWKTLRTTPEEFFRPNGDHTPVELAAKYQADHQRVVRDGVTIETEEAVQTRAGEMLQVQAMKVPVLGSDGAIKGSQGCFLDITDRKRMEQALAYERDLLRTLLDNSPDSIYFKDLQSRFLRCSHAFAHRVGTNKPEDLLGKTDFDLFQQECARESFGDERQIIATGDPIIGKVERELWKDGSITWVLTSKMPYRNNDGEIIGTFGISKDITELKKAEAELEATHRQLLDASRRAGMAEVATGVLHNVGNVLNSVNVSTTVVTDMVRKSKTASVQRLAEWLGTSGAPQSNGPVDSKAVQLREYVTKLGEHLAQEQRTMLSELNLLSSHIEHMKEIVAMQQTYAKVSGVTEPLTPESLAEDALRMNSAALVRHDVHVQRDFEDVPRVIVDRHKVLQILINLISNAKYALDAGAPAKKVLTISIRANESFVAMTVADNGVGIEAENLTRIFQHGFTTRATGHGFGLHSSAIAARELGGALRASSDGPGRGASFVLELPIETTTPVNSPAYDQLSIA
jgi:PAS domain S-box-containing protein